MMRYAGIKKFDIENGIGIGLTLFTQGCTKNCLGCHNPSTHSFEGGLEFTPSVLKEICDTFEKNRQIKRFTLSGGDALENLDLCNWILDVVTTKFPYLKIWIYTGFEYEYLVANKKYLNFLFNYCDILVDGKFNINKRNPNLAFRGSSNQRIIDVQKSLKEHKIIELDL